ncbi:hypothetical protein EHM76_05815 [bacterium]|nr:MAG: hypothetical protein EHM76_05815 [bacterium]
MTERQTFTRFAVAQRIEHILLIVSFMTLVITGLPQKFAGAGWAEWMVAALGGIETLRVIHRVAATIFILETIYHIVVVFYKIYVTRDDLTMLPGMKDAKDAWQTVTYNLGFSKVKPKMGRYTFDEKAEYWALIWGSVVMVITGFMLWNPIATARILPGQFIPAAKAAHGAEALLAFLAILLWHTYHVHIRTFNKSMFTGELNREEMAHEHPLELEKLESGVYTAANPRVVRKRRSRYLPIAAVVTVALLATLYYFTTFEETAIATIPPASNVPVFVPQTPTPLPTLAPTPTSQPTVAGAALTWDASIAALFDQRCGVCHGTSGGYNVATYTGAIEGGDTEIAIIPGDPENSPLVILQTGAHPGKFTPEELEQIKTWIAAGAPEN